MRSWTLLAQAAGAPGVVEWLQYGVLGLVVVAIILGWLVPGRTYEREVKRADRLEEENERLREHNEQRVVPLLTRAMDLLDQLPSSRSRGSDS